MTNQELAEITALQVITFLAGDENHLSWLMNETGLSQGDLSACTENPELMAGVLDFLLNHEDILLDFCNSAGIEPAAMPKIRTHFPGANMEAF